MTKYIFAFSNFSSKKIYSTKYEINFLLDVYLHLSVLSSFICCTDFLKHLSIYHLLSRNNEGGNYWLMTI